MAGKVKRNLNFRKLLEKKWKLGKIVCVGLDSQYDKIPNFIKRGVKVDQAVFNFNKEIIDVTHDLILAYKLQYAFYGALGESGITALKKTVAYIHKKHPDIPVILDAKRNDIGNTAEQYAVEVFDTYGVDAVTANPYLGFDGVEPFLKRKNKGVIVLCRTSNPSAKEFQDLVVNHSRLGKVPLYHIIAYQVVKKWNKNNNCCLVVGATYPKEAAQIRALAPTLPFLIPGIGKQGGDIKKAVINSKDKQGGGMIINSSRGIIFASEKKDFAQVARRETKKLDQEIRKYL